jgi:hypothetical protein
MYFDVMDGCRVETPTVGEPLGENGLAGAASQRGGDIRVCDAVPRRRLGVGGQQAEAPGLPKFIGKRRLLEQKGGASLVPLDAGGGDNGLVPGREQRVTATDLAWCEDAAERMPSLVQGKSPLSVVDLGAWSAPGARMASGCAQGPLDAVRSDNGLAPRGGVPLDAARGDNGLVPWAEVPLDAGRGDNGLVRSAEASGEAYVVAAWNWPLASSTARVPLDAVRGDNGLERGAEELRNNKVVESLPLLANVTSARIPSLAADGLQAFSGLRASRCCSRR